MTRKLILTGALATGVLAAVPLQAGVVVGISLGSHVTLTQYRGHADPRLSYRIGLEHGAEDGQRKGYEDARKHRSLNAHRHSWYREGDRGYQHRYGPRWNYAHGYRRGFERSYENAYRRAMARHGHGEDYRDRGQYGYENGRDDRNYGGNYDER